MLNSSKNDQNHTISRVVLAIARYSDFALDNDTTFYFYDYQMKRLMGYEVDKPSKFLTKTSNAAEYIESDIQNIKAPRPNDTII